MKKTLRMLLLVLVLCVGLVMPAAAETTDGFASDHICMVDMAGVLNEQEVTELEMMIDEIRTRQKFDIAILFQRKIFRRWKNMQMIFMTEPIWGMDRQETVCSLLLI